MKKRICSALTAAALLAGLTAAMPVTAEGTVLHAADFESGTAGWSSFGGASVAVTNNSAHGGKQSLYVSGRGDSWHGAALMNLDSVLTAGETYQFDAWVNGQSGDTVSLTIKYTDSSGNAQYKGIGSASVGSWAEISESYTVPSDATDILVYFQTAAGTNDFLVDDVSISGKASWSEAALAETPLKDIYADYFRIGCAATPSEVNTTIAEDIVKRHFNSLTIGNELKPDYVMNKTATQASGSNTRVAVSLEAAAPLLSFCEQNNIPIRGHVFCWYSQTPGWFFREGFKDDGAIVSKDVMNTRLENYIHDVIDRIAAEYPNLNVYCWDVVNECYLDDGSLRAGGTDPSNQESYWSLIYGDNSYIEQAFTYARKYAPAGTKLFYNDFNEYIPAKRDAIYSMASSLKSKGLIDGIGMQSHLDVGYPDASLFRQAIDKYASLGLEVQITELDITQYNSTDLSKQTKAYSDIMKQIIDAKENGANITAVVFWGITDGTSWRKTGYPLLLNADYSLKDSWYSVKNALPESKWGKAEETTEATTETTAETTTEEVTYAESPEITVTALPDKTVYAQGEALDLTGGEVFLRTWDNDLWASNGTQGTPREFTKAMTEFTQGSSMGFILETDYNADVPGAYIVTLTFRDEHSQMSTDFTVTVEGSETSTSEPTTVTDGMIDLAAGDVYMDGEVNLLDVIQMQKFLTRQTDELTVRGPLFAVPIEFIRNHPWDVYEDGVCNVFDLAKLKRIVFLG